jgi:hypothetical protein
MKYSKIKWMLMAASPLRSAAQAICLLAGSRTQQKVLQGLVEAYPGFLAAGGGTGANPVRKKFLGLKNEAGSQSAQEFLDQMKVLSRQLEEEFPGKFDAAKKTVTADLAWMQAQP